MSFIPLSYVDENASPLQPVTAQTTERRRHSVIWREIWHEHEQEQARLAAALEEETRLTEDFARSHFSGKGRLPFLPPGVVAAYAEIRKAIGALPRPFSHEDAADMLLELSKYRGGNLEPVDLVPLVDYLVLWLKHRAPESRRVRERHLAPLLAQLVRFVHVLHKIEGLKAKEEALRQLVYDQTEECVASACSNTSVRDWEAVHVDSILQFTDRLGNLASMAYQLIMMRSELRPMMRVLHRPCAHVAGLIKKELDREQDRHVPAAAYAGIVTRVHNASGTCAICLDGLADRDDETGQPRRAAHRLACGHQFHPTCLYKLLVSTGTNTACPICRFETMPDAA